MRGAFVFMTVLWLLAAGSLAARDMPVSYEIEVKLDPSQHRLAGTQTVLWTNTASAPTSELQLHLYLNAFANRRTTFMRELTWGTLRSRGAVEMDYGWINLTAFTLEGGVDLMPTLEFLQPEDGNPDDLTVARVRLPEPVLPGETVRLSLSFAAQLPRIIARTGFAGDFHMVGQWYPKLGVYEDVGVGGREEAGWNCHQFHANSEFYADFASYRVSITVPPDWVVGASGVEVIRETVEEAGASYSRLVHQADRVHDFAWCAAPATLMEVVEADFDPARDVPSAWLDLARQRLGLSAAELELPPIHLRLLVPISQRAVAGRILRATRASIAWFGLFYGPYPYPQLTVVAPPITAEEAGGMEYQTFITTQASKLMAYAPVSWRPRIESVTTHEFAHQYFQGLLASNEFEQAWLDEGLTSYSELECTAAIIEGGLAPEVRWGDLWTQKKLFLAFFRQPVRIDRRSWEYRGRAEYFLASYGKTALALRTLEGLLGPDVFARAMRTYVQRFKFAHPTGDDFFATMSEVAGEDLGWFFEQSIRGDATADWAVLAVRNRKDAEAVGFQWQAGEWMAADERDDGADEADAAGSETYQVEVDLGRRGDFIGPVDVRLSFSDGSEETRRWDGRERWVRWSWSSKLRVQQVVIDPEAVWALETRRNDNYWRDDSGSGRDAGWWTAAIIQSLGLMALPWI